MAMAVTEMAPPDVVAESLRREDNSRGRSAWAACIVLLGTVFCLPLMMLDPYPGTVCIGIVSMLAVAGAILLKYQRRLVLNLQTAIIYGMAIQYLLAPVLVRLITNNFDDWFGQSAERAAIKDSYSGAMIVVTLFIGVFMLINSVLPTAHPARWWDGRLAIAFSKRAYLVMGLLYVQLWFVRLASLAHGVFYTLNTRKDFFQDSRYSSWAQYASGMGPVMVAFAWGALLNKRIPAPLVLGFTAVEFTWNFLSGGREQTLTVPLTALLAVIVYRDRLPWKSMLLAIFPVLAVIGFMDHYRYALIRTTDPNQISISGITSALSTALRGSEAEGTSGSALRGLMRLNDLESIAAIYHAVPNDQPYLYGETYWRTFPALIPRQLVAEKERVGIPINEWFFLHEGGSSPITTPGEGYLNLGWVGVVISSVLTALMVKVVELVAVRFLWNGAVLPAYIGAMAVIARLHTQPIAVWATTVPKILLLIVVVHLFTRPRHPLDEAREAARLAAEYEQSGHSHPQFT